MIENFSKKQEKIQEKVQKQQELNDKDCRELTDEELDQIVGGKDIASPDPVPGALETQVAAIVMTVPETVK